MENKKILIVDDEKDIDEVLTHFVKSIGFEVVVALSGKEALEILDLKKPDLILLDIAMPGMDGLEVLRGIRKKDVEVPVVIITAYKDAEKVVEGFRLGAKDCIFKPFDLDYLAKVIRSLI